VKVGWQRRTRAFIAAVLASSLTWALCFVEQAAEHDGPEFFGDSFVGSALILLVIAPALVIFATLGCLLALVIERAIPRSVYPPVFCAVGAASGGVFGAVLDALVLKAPRDVMVAVPSAAGGFVAAAVWWKMVRAKERMTNG